MRYPIPVRRANRLLAPSTMSFNFTTTAHIRGPLDLGLLEAALAKTCRRHPMLAARALLIDDDHACLTDEGSKPVPIDIVARETETSWVAEVERGLPIRPDFARGPLLRCIWVKGDGISDLVLVSDHGTADGRSAVYALRDLLRFLGDPGLELPAIPPQRMAGFVPQRIRDRVAALLAAEDAAAGGQPPPPPAPWSPPVSDKPRTITPISLDQTQTAALLAACRHNGVTVQAALSAAFLKPFAERSPEAPLRRAEVPVDLRPYLEGTEREWYGSFLSLALVDVDCQAGRGLWDIARAAQAAWKAVNIDDLFFVPPAVFQIADRAPAVKMFDAAYDVSISNLGRLDLPVRFGAFELLGVHAPTFNVLMPGHRVLGVATAAGRLMATYTSRDPAAVDLARRGTENLLAMMG